VPRNNGEPSTRVRSNQDYATNVVLIDAQFALQKRIAPTTSVFIFELTTPYENQLSSFSPIRASQQPGQLRKPITSADAKPLTELAQFYTSADAKPFTELTQSIASADA
jgi:hypothetical protein